MYAMRNEELELNSCGLTDILACTADENLNAIHALITALQLWLHAYWSMS